MGGEPAAPAALRGHARIDLHHDNEDAGCEQREVDQRQEQNARRVALLERVENPSIPNVHCIRRRKVEDDDQ
jgi:hypothetical protein